MKKQSKLPLLSSIFLLFILFGAFAVYLLSQDKKDEDVVIDKGQTGEQNSQLNRGILDESLRLGKSFLMNNQKEAGNFNYEYDFVSGTFNADDNQVRQAGALWGIALIHQDEPTVETREAIIRGLDFFDSISKETEDGGKYIVYPTDEQGSTGTIALIVLTHVDLLRSEENLPNREHYEEELGKYLKFLLSLRIDNGQFSSRYKYDTGEGFGRPSPYFDGESLLALVKAAKYAGYEEDLKQTILDSAYAMHRLNVERALDKDPDSDTTKGFYQWGSMSFYEIFTSGWEEVDDFGDYTIDLAYWMIDTHKTLTRPKNTAYAYEGLISAWEIARLKDDKRAMKKIGDVIDQGLLQLTSWQVGGPVQNDFLKNNSTDDPLAVGGVMNAADEPPLRIDVTQHQMHAVILARRFIYK